ncbi:hypothetical protein B566_EDAN017003 [Ephemera danica]|nr:hypothetical protein B566_EDAN017003 [Ephemera danica]
MRRQCDKFLHMADGIDGEMQQLVCPAPGQPEHFTECCAGEALHCCPAATWLQQMDSNRCPLYNVCRVNYTQGGVIAYNKEEDPLTSCMPGDWEGQSNYSPNAVKIKPVEDI